MKETSEIILQENTTRASNTYTTTLTKDGYIRCTFSYTGSTTGTIDLKIGGTTVESKTVVKKTSDIPANREVIFDTKCKEGQSITVKHTYVGDGQASIPCYYLRLYDFTKNFIDIKPYEVKSIGAFTTCFLYGMKNGTYIGGIITGDTSSATTGSITLGNAVGFLEINYNGEIVKVPYYK